MDWLRRTIEVIIAVFALIVTSPLLFVAGLLIRCGDRGPVIHKRRVVGKGGLEFDAFKLRSMRVDADEWLATQPNLKEAFEIHHKLPGDPRVTSVGRILRRLSIDELPQLVNVLRGQMSLVGPRMFHPSELPYYGEHADEILSIRPGITGLWQVSGRQDLDRKTRVEMDLRYVRDRTLKTDLIILLKTIPAAMLGRGAY